MRVAELAQWRTALAAHGRVQIPNWLPSADADALHAVLRERVDWSLAYREDARPALLAPAALAALGEAGYAERLAGIARAARGRYAFAYESYPMVAAYLERRDPDHPLHRLLEALNAPAHLEFVRALSGDAGIRRVSAQATRYRPGHFLRRHDDLETTQGRRYAYVLNLGRDWVADWGGLLQFLDADGRVIDTFHPRYNSLSLFRVPAAHQVSLVAPWAEGERLAITGWWMG